MDQHVWLKYRGLCLKVMAKIWPSSLQILPLNWCCDWSINFCIVFVLAFAFIQKWTLMIKYLSLYDLVSPIGNFWQIGQTTLIHLAQKTQNWFPAHQVWDEVHVALRASTSGLAREAFVLRKNSSKLETQNNHKWCLQFGATALILTAQVLTA